MRTATWLEKDGKAHVAPQLGAGRCGASVRAPGAVRASFLFALAVLLLGAPAWAKPRIAIVPFGRYPVERELTQSLCAEVTCVPSNQVLRQGRLDWDRVAAAQLTGVVTGKIGRDTRTGKRVVDIQVFAPGHLILVRKKATLTQMGLSASALKVMTADLVGVLNRAHGPEREAAPPSTKPPAETTLVPAVVPPAPGAAPAKAAPAAPPVTSPAPTTIHAVGEEVAAEAEPTASADNPEPSLLEVEVAFNLLNREYSYSTTSTGLQLLRNTMVPLFVAPGLLLGIFPLRSSTGVFESLGLELGGAVSYGMEVQRAVDVSGTTFPAVSVAANVALLTRLRLGKTVRLTPVVGWQMSDFDVYKSATGVTLTGQPSVHWRAIRAGLKLDVNFNAWCALYLELSYLYVYSAGALTRSPYFTSSSPAPSFDTALGLAFRVAPPFEIRTSVVFTRYALNFSGGGPANITGVTDQLVGFTLGFRYSY